MHNGRGRYNGGDDIMVGSYKTGGAGRDLPLPLQRTTYNVQRTTSIRSLILPCHVIDKSFAGNAVPAGGRIVTAEVPVAGMTRTRPM